MAGLDLFAMDDNGMWFWAGILTAGVLVASFAVAVWWQRWKEKRQPAD